MQRKGSATTRMPSLVPLVAVESPPISRLISLPCRQVASSPQRSSVIRGRAVVEFSWVSIPLQVCTRPLSVPTFDGPALPAEDIYLLYVSTVALHVIRASYSQVPLQARVLTSPDFRGHGGASNNTRALPLRERAASPSRSITDSLLVVAHWQNARLNWFERRFDTCRAP